MKLSKEEILDEIASTLIVGKDYWRNRLLIHIKKKFEQVIQNTIATAIENIVKERAEEIIKKYFTAKAISLHQYRTEGAKKYLNQIVMVDENDKLTDTSYHSSKMSMAEYLCNYKLQCKLKAEILNIGTEISKILIAQAFESVINPLKEN